MIMNIYFVYAIQIGDIGCIRALLIRMEYASPVRSY
jgi:hypothetical protein